MNPAMLFINTTIQEVVMITITSIIGIFGVAAGLSGFVFRNMKWWERILCIVGGLTLLVPGSLTDLIGLVLVGAVCVTGDIRQRRERRKRWLRKIHNLKYDKGRVELRKATHTAL